MCIYQKGGEIGMMKRINLTVPEDLDKRLTEKARELGISKSSLVQRWILENTSDKDKK